MIPGTTQPVAAVERTGHGDGRAGSTRGALALFLLAVIGQASALFLVDVQPFAVYQHLQPWAWVMSGRTPAIWWLLAQVVLLVAVVWRLRPRLTVWGRVFGIRGLAVAAALAAASLAVPTVSLSRFAGEIALSGPLAVVSALNLLLAVALIPESLLGRVQSWLDARISLGADDRYRRWDRRVPFVVAAWIVVVAAVASYAVSERVPHIDDSISYYFQAKYHAAGYLYLPPPPDAASFAVDEVIIEPTKWYGYGLPGWPMVLAAGVWLGAPWLVNPTLGGLLILCGHAVLRRRYGYGTANAAALLLALSPWMIFMSAEFMPHPLTALLVMLGALAFHRSLENGRRWLGWALLAGVAIGWIALTRPFEAPLLVTAFGLTALIDGKFRPALRSAVVAGIVAFALSALVLPFNQTVTGRSTYPPQMAWTDRRWGPGVDRPGFGPDIGIPEWRQIDPLPGHGIADVVLNLNKNAFMANLDLFGWAPGSLAGIWIAVALARWRRSDSLALSLISAFVVGYSFFWFSGGPDLGPRYWYPLLVPLAALSVRGAQMLAEALEGRAPAFARPGARIGAVMVAASLSAAVTMLPWRAITKHYRYRGIGGQIRELASAHGFAQDIVFVRSTERSDYQSAFNLNPPTLDAPGTVYAFDAGPASRAAVVARFPDRRLWVVGPRDDGTGRDRSFDVLVGPLAPGTEVP